MVPQVDKGLRVLYIRKVVDTRTIDTRGKGDQMASHMTAKEAGVELNLEHTEVIRRIRKGQIKASKMGWFWLIPVQEVEEVKQSDWWKNVMHRRGIDVTAQTT